MVARLNLCWIAVLLARLAPAASVAVSDGAALAAALGDPAVAEVDLAGDLAVAGSFVIETPKTIRGHGFKLARNGSDGTAFLVADAPLVLEDVVVAMVGDAAGRGGPAGALYCGSGGSTSSCAKQSSSKCETKFQWDDAKEVAGACTWDGSECFRGEPCVDEDPPPTPSPTSAPTAIDRPVPGGCVVVRAGGSLDAFNATFAGCSTEGDGGAVRAEAGARVSVAASTFAGCSAGGDGGAVHAVDATLALNGSRFVAPTAAGSGGAVSFDGGTASVVDCIFEAAAAGAAGGGVAFHRGALRVDGSRFDECTAASGAGGGVASLAPDASVDVAGSYFYRCAAMDGDDGHGGGLWASAASLAITRSSFDGCGSGEHGGAFGHDAPGGAAKITDVHVIRSGRHVESYEGRELVLLNNLDSVVLSGVIADDNLAGTRGVFVLSALTDVVVENSVFTNNDARVFRVFQLYTGSFVVRDCFFGFNVDHSGEGGAAIFLKETPATRLVFERTSFVSNRAAGDESLGGAIWLSANARIDDCLFQSNSAAEGGALYLSIAVLRLKLTASEFRANEAQVGGAIAACATSGDWTFGGTVDVADLVAEDNRALTADAYKAGGGFAKFKGGTITVRGARIRGNYAAGVGSAIGLQYSAAAFYNVARDANQTLFLSKDVRVSAYCDALAFVEEADAHGMFDTTFEAPECSKCLPGAEWRGAPDFYCAACAPGSYKDTGDAACTACPAGTYRDSAGAVDCETCVENRVPVADASECVECAKFGFNMCATPGDVSCACCAGYFMNRDGVCVACPRGADCTAPGATLATLEMRPKFYRTTPTSTKTYRCLGDDRACPGGAGAGNELCAEGYHGVLCAECARARYPTSDDDGKLRCDKCERGSRAFAYVVYALLAAVLLGGALWMMLTAAGREVFILMADTQGGAADDIVGALQSQESDADDADALDRAGLSERFGNQIGKIKAVAAFFQILAAVPAVYGPDLDLPWAYRGLQKATEIFMLGFMDLVPTRCLTAVSSETFYVQGLVCTTLSPLAVFAFLFCGFRVDRALNPVVDGRDNRKNLYIEAFLLFMHLALPLLSITSVQSLVCDAYDMGHGKRDEEMLRAAPAISCESALWQKFIRPYGLVCTLVYPIGVPIVYAVLLYAARKDLNPTHAVPLLDVFAEPAADPASPRKDSMRALARAGSTRKLDASTSRESAEKKMSAATRALLIRREEYQESLMDYRNAKIESANASDVEVPTAAFKFLWRDYEPRVYWWECLEVLRRVFFTALLSAIDPGSKLQLALGVFISIIYLALYIQERPFVIEEDDMVAEVAAWGVVTTLFVCFLIRSLTSFHRKNLAPITTLILFASAALPLVAVVAILWTAYTKAPEDGADEKTAAAAAAADDDDDDDAPRTPSAAATPRTVAAAEVFLRDDAVDGAPRDVAGGDPQPATCGWQSCSDAPATTPEASSESSLLRDVLGVDAAAPESH